MRLTQKKILRILGSSLRVKVYSSFAGKMIWLLLINFLALSFSSSSQTATISGTNLITCQGATTQPTITFTGSGGVQEYTFEYTRDGVPQTAVTTSGSNQHTINIPTNTVGSFTYEITRVTDGNSNSTDITGQSLTVEIIGPPVVVLDPNNNPVEFCFNETLQNSDRLHFIHQNPYSEIFVQIQWQWSTDQNTWNNINGDTDPYFLTPPTNVAGVRYYRVMLTPTNPSQAGCASGVSANKQVTVLQPLNPGTVNTGAGGTFCVGWTETINSTALPTGGSGNYTYLWQESVGCNGTWSDAPGTNNNASYTRNNFASTGTYCYRRMVTDNECPTTAPAVFSEIVQFTIVPDLISQSINPSPNSNSVCAGTSVSATFNGGGGEPGLYTDIYEISTNGGNTWTPYTPGAAVATTGLSEVRIRTRRESSQPNGCDFGNYVVHTWTVNNAPPTPQPYYIRVGNPTEHNPPLCIGDNFQLMANGTTAPLTWTGPNGFNAPSPPLAASPTRNNAQLTMAGTYTLTKTVNGCSSSGTVDVVINTQPNPFSIQASGSTTFCTPGSVTLSYPLTPGSLGFQWYRDGNPIPGANGATYNATESGVYSLAAGNSGCNTISTNTIQVTANVTPDRPEIVTSDPISFCENEASILRVDEPDENSFYLWEYFTAGSWHPLNLDDGSGESYISMAVNQTGNYRVTATSLVGSCVSPTSNSFSVTAMPLPNLPPIGAADDDICLGESTSFPAPSPHGGMNPVWASSNTDVATVNSSGVITSQGVGSSIISYTITSPTNGCKNTVTKPINVSSLPVVTVTASPSAICLGESTILAATVNPTASLSTFTDCNDTRDQFLNNPNLGLQHMANTSITVSLPGVTDMSQITSMSVQIDITHPTVGEVEVYLVKNCPGDPGDGIINLGNQPNSQATQQTVPGRSIELVRDRGNNGNNFSNTIFTSLPGAPSIITGTPPFTGTFSPEQPFLTGPNRFTGNPNCTWTLRVVDDTNSGDVGTLLNWCISFTYGSGYTYTWRSEPTGFTYSTTAPNPTIEPPFNTVSPTVDTRYFMSSTSNAVNGCTGEGSVLVTVQQPPTITGLVNPTVCQGTTSAPLAYTGTTNNPTHYSIVWSAAALTQGFTNVTEVALPASPISLTVPAVVAFGTYTGTLIPISDGCTGTDVPFSININGVTPGLVSGNRTVCLNGDPAAFTQTVPATGPSGAQAPTYQWQSSTVDCSTGFADIPGATGNTYDVPPGVAVTTYYRRVATSVWNGVPCTAVSNCLTVTVNTINPGSIAGDQTICEGGNPAAFTSTAGANGSAPLISYQWQSNTTGCGDEFTNIGGATAAIYDPPPGLTTTTYYRRIATSTLNGQDCSEASNCIVVTVNEIVTPDFPDIGPLCQGSTPPALSNTSPNGITGTWAPATISTASAGTTDYVFTPTAGLCAEQQTLTITVDPLLTPDFAAIGPLCQGSTPPSLPSISNNGIAGTWSPSVISTNSLGASTYTFTPDDDECATIGTILVTITQPPAPTVECYETATWNPTTCEWEVTGTQPLTDLALSSTDAGCGIDNGTLTIDAVTGGTAPYTYSVNGSPFTATTSYTDLAAGSYTVIVRDNNGCEFSTTAAINNTNGPTDLEVTAADAACGASDGSLTIGTVTGGTAPYTYSVNGSTFTAEVQYDDLAAGTYTIVVRDDNGCEFSTSISIVGNNTAPPSTTNITICSDELPYSWNGVTYNSAGTYDVVLQGSNGCDSLATLVLTVSASLPGQRYTTVVTGPNVPVQLTARNLGAGYSYEWNPKFGLNDYSSATPTFSYDRDMEYTIAITPTTGCAIVDTVFVRVLDNIPPDQSGIYVPKAWTPNGDGHNDKLFPIPVNIKDLKYFRVFNRWGQLVFETNTLRDGWDGIFKGQPQVSDTYTWTLEAEGNDGKYYKLAGNSVLLR